MTDAEKAARWRMKHPEQTKVVALRARTKLRKLVADHKASVGCEDCGITDARVLDLHHREGDEKLLAVSAMIARHAIAQVVREIQKCCVVCANCHRIRHAEETVAKLDAGFTSN